MDQNKGLNSFLFRKGISKEFLMLIVLAVLIYTYLISFLGFDFRYIFGDLGDARLNNYFLEHGYQFLIGNNTSFWSAPFYYPTQNVMAYSDNHIGTLPLYSIFRFLGNDIETSYQYWMVSIFLLNGFSSYLVLRLFNFNQLGSLAGALLFTIAAPVMLKTGHFQMLPRFMVPFIFYSAVRYLKTMDLKYFYILCFSVVCQFYIGIYIAFFVVFSFFLISPFFILYIKRKRLFIKILSFSHLFFIFIAIFLSSIFLILLLKPYIEYKDSSGGRSWNELLSMLPRFESWFYTFGSYYDSLNEIGLTLPMQHEHYMFIGWVPYILFISVSILFFLNYMKKKIWPDELVVTVSLLLIFLTFITTITFKDFSLYKIFYFIPGFDAIRAVTRIVLFLIFPFAIILAYVITRLSEMKNIFKSFFIILFLLVFGVIEQYRSNVPVYNKHDAQNRYAEIVGKVSEYGDEFDIIYVWNIKPSPGFFADEIDAMYASLILGKYTINGYSGNIPKNYSLWFDNDYASWVEYNMSYFCDIDFMIYYASDSTLDIVEVNGCIRDE